MLTKKRVANKRHLSKNKRALFCNKARFCLIIMTQSDRPHESFCGLFELEGVACTAETLLCTSHSQHHSRVDIQLTAQFSTNFQRWLAFAVHDFTDTGIAKTKHLCEFSLGDAHFVET